MCHICRNFACRSCFLKYICKVKALGLLQSASTRNWKQVRWKHGEGRGACSCPRQREPPQLRWMKFHLTFSQNKEPHCEVDKDPGEAQELHEVVHEQVPFLQIRKSCKAKQDGELWEPEERRKGLDDNSSPLFTWWPWAATRCVYQLPSTHSRDQLRRKTPAPAMDAGNIVPFSLCSS